jgi:AsmA protein
MRFLKILGAGIAVVIVLIAIVLVVGIPGGLLTDVIQNRIERQTGYRLEIDETSIHLRPNPTIALSGISLTDARNRENSIELTVASAKAQVSLASLLRGKFHVDELIVTQPVLHAPLHRERLRRRENSGGSGGVSSKTPTTDALASIGHIAIDNGTIVMQDKQRGVENRLDNVRFDMTVGADRKMRATFDAVASGKPIGLEANASIPQGTLAAVTIPVDFKLKVPAILTQELNAAAQVKLDGSTVQIDALKGDLDGARFNGNASVELESKPQVKVNLDLARIGITRAAVGDTGAAAAASAQPATPLPWSDKPFDLRGLNYVDAQTHLSIGELDIGTIKIAPLEIEASLADGIVRGTVSKVGIYDGQAAAGIAMDASADKPSFAVRAELRQVHALPLLSSAADFTRLEGKLDATVNIQAVGSSQRDVVSNLAGIAVTKFQDGEVRGINVAKMIRALTNGTLAGWQEGQSETTDLTELSASFQIDHGQAQTQDFKLAGPLVRVTGIGTADLNTKAINFRLEPKLVMTTQGQGASGDPIGFGVPVMVQGPWNQPRFFLDMAGILDNPDAAYAQLRQLGQGLFGSNFLQPNAATGNAPNTNTPAGNNIMNGIGNLIQGLTGKPNQTAPAGQTPATQQAPAQGQQAAPAQGQAAQGGAANPSQAAPAQGQSALGGATGQQAVGPAPGQPATGGGLGQILGPQQKGQLDQIMQNLFGSGGSNSPAPSK